MSDKQIYDRNMEFLRRVPLEDFFEHLVRALRSERQKEEQTIMATVDATQQAITRFQAAVDARETAEESKISDLEAHVVPDSLVQSINDAAAKIEAQNNSSQSTAAAPVLVVDGAGAGDAQGGQGGTAA